VKTKKRKDNAGGYKGDYEARKGVERDFYKRVRALLYRGFHCKDPSEGRREIWRLERKIFEACSLSAGGRARRYAVEIVTQAARISMTFISVPGEVEQTILFHACAQARALS
jgi:hypothetical protein